MTRFREVNSDFQMVSGMSLVNRSGNLTLRHVGSTLDEETLISECISAVDSLPLVAGSDVDIFRTDSTVREVFRNGYGEELLKLPDTFKLYMLETFVGSSQITFGFGLLRLKPDVLPISVKFLKSDSFEKFKREISLRFGTHFDSLGSDDFLDRLHSYFTTHGNSRKLDAAKVTYFAFEGRADEYMTYTALVLKDIYGEQKVMDFLDRLITEMPSSDFQTNISSAADDHLTVTAVDALQIIKSGVDLSETPLHWAAQIASNND